jgi:hypothetical protein
MKIFSPKINLKSLNYKPELGWTKGKRLDLAGSLHQMASQYCSQIAWTPDAVGTGHCLHPTNPFQRGFYRFFTVGKIKPLFSQRGVNA